MFSSKSLQTYKEMQLSTLAVTRLTSTNLHETRSTSAIIQSRALTMVVASRKTPVLRLLIQPSESSDWPDGLVIIIQFQFRLTILFPLFPCESRERKKELTQPLTSANSHFPTPMKIYIYLDVVVVVVAFSLHVRILGECSIIHSLPVLFHPQQPSKLR